MQNLTASQKLLLQNYRQVASIVMDDITITNEDILEGGMVINRSTQSGTSLEIGSVIAAEMALQLQNFDGRFNADDFEGKTLSTSISATDGTDTATLQMGYFIIDSVAKKNRAIQITALDRMAAFDKDATAWTGTKTLANVIIWCATQCNVPCQLTVTDLSIYPNYNVAVDFPEESHTYRELLSWACECMGICAYADWTGRLAVGWYSNTGLALTAADRKENSTQVAENAITVTGIKIDDTQYGNDGYILQITDNDFATQKSATVGPALRTWLNGFSYVPISTTVLPMPWVWPLDGGTNDTLPVIVTNMTFKLNGFTALSAKGESLTKKGMAQANPLTRRESALVKALQEATRADYDMKIDNLLLMNQLAAYSMGLYPHVEELPDGSKIFTYTDQPELADSEKVYRFNANGFFVSNDGGETWISGLDGDGNLVVHILTADTIVTGTIRDATGNNYWNLDTGDVHFQSVTVLAEGVEQAQASANQAQHTATDAMTNASAAQTLAEAVQNLVLTDYVTTSEYERNSQAVQSSFTSVEQRIGQVQDIADGYYDDLSNDVDSLRSAQNTANSQITALIANQSTMEQTARSISAEVSQQATLINDLETYTENLSARVELTATGVDISGGDTTAKTYVHINGDGLSITDGENVSAEFVGERAYVNQVYSYGGLTFTNGKNGQYSAIWYMDDNGRAVLK